MTIPSHPVDTTVTTPPAPPATRSHPTTHHTPPQPPDLSALSGTQRNAYIAIQAMLSQWGLDSLAPQILKWVQDGQDAQTINYQLQQTKEYKTRFSGNEMRVANGLAALDPGTYLATEAAYRQVMQAAGLPSSFYSSPAEFAKLIGADLSPSEVQSRANEAAAFVNSKDPNQLAAMQAYHGIDKAHLIAHYLDPAAASNLLARQSQEALMGAAALDQGLHLTDLNRVDTFIDQGVSVDQARTGYQNAATVLPETSKLGQIYHDPYSQNDAEDEFVGGMASANRKRKQLAQREVDTFNGSGGINSGTLGQQTRGSY